MQSRDKRRRELLGAAVLVAALAGFGQLAGAQGESLADVLGRAQPIPLEDRVASENDVNVDVSGCWLLPADLRRDISYPVDVWFEIDAAGMLTGSPRALNGTDIDSSSDLEWAVVRDSALAAVAACQPYENLADPEALQKIVIIRMDPFAPESEPLP